MKPISQSLFTLLLYRDAQQYTQNKVNFEMKNKYK